ncbi:MAG: acylphosphatase [Saprospiraceae bacterium]|nr:acylphosphatase [Saprospiraceae bacterium]
MDVQIRIRITGKVQGVWFRQCTREKAIDLNLQGWVRNDDDGSVIIVAAGKRDQLNQFVEWVHQGSPQSRVDDVLITEEPASAFEGFVIVR